MIGLIVWLAMAAGQGQYAVSGTSTNWPTDRLLSGSICTGACPEPIDVPAVHRSNRKVVSYRECDADDYMGSDANGGKLCIPAREWTCTDESRVLLVSVNSKQAVCHKITEEK